MIAIRYLDLVLLALALPVFLLGGLPMLGYAAGAAAWLVQRGVQLALNRKAAAADDPRTVVGIVAGSMIGRGWLVALSIFPPRLKEGGGGPPPARLLLRPV